MTMQARDWKYIGEGGKHAIFGYEPSTTRIKKLEEDNTCCQEESNYHITADEEWIGYVLRISKQDIACSVLVCSSAKKNTQYYCDGQVEGGGGDGDDENLINEHHLTDDNKNNNQDDASFYIRNIVAPSLGVPYVDHVVAHRRRTVRLDWEFLNQLRNQCLLEECIIPEKRRADWFHETYYYYAGKHDRKQFQQKQQQLLPYSIGVLLTDYRRPPPLTLLAHSSSLCRDTNHHHVQEEENGRLMTSFCSIEIKPKAGYLAFSPLVSPNHRVKYSTSRFQLLQKLYAMGKHYRAWMVMEETTNLSTTTSATSPHTGRCNSNSTHSSSRGSNSDMSDYDPLDLFSGETDRIHKAIKALMNCPQNCFKMWINGVEQHVSSSSLSFSQQQQPQSWPRNKILAAINAPCADISGHFDGCKNKRTGDGHDDGKARLHDDASAIFAWTSPEFLAIIVTTILQEEELLKNLLKLQRLDILDGEGAILVYQRLLALLGGSAGHCEEESICELAERCLDSVSVQSLTTTTTTTTASEQQLLQHPLLRSSPFRLPSTSARIQSFCSEVETVERVTRQPTVDGALIASSVIDEAHRRATQIVHDMDKEELQYLLQLWLLSLAMCDVSFFVILRELPQCCAGEKTQQEENLIGNTTNDNDTTSIYSCFRIEEMQSEGKPGILSFVSQRNIKGSTSTRRRLAYELKVIDCDRKPAKKLRSRDKKEDLFDYFANSSNHQNNM